MAIREAYEKSLHREGHERDSAQQRIVGLLEDLQHRLCADDSRQTTLLGRWFRSGRKQRAAQKGLYIWGGVGRGKTFLMDLFFETLALDAKRRIHFHRMMRDVHERLAKLDNVADPLDRIAADIAAETRVLCFDEFYVSDIGDAMILGRLLDGLFARGLTLVATSNIRPDDLYKDGLQRQQFLPAIDLLNRYTDVVQIAGDTDYRLRLLQRAGTYLTPHDEVAERKLKAFFDAAASSQITAARRLDINGRQICTRYCAKGIAWFDFSELCSGPRSQNDYIEIARWYPEVIVSGVPRLDSTQEDQARRFVALVDEFYDRRVKLIVAAAAGPDALYEGKRLAFEFERTASRLIEMQSTDYLAAPHLG